MKNRFLLIGLAWCCLSLPAVLAFAQEAGRTPATSLTVDTAQGPKILALSGIAQVQVTEKSSSAPLPEAWSTNTRTTVNQGFTRKRQWLRFSFDVKDTSGPAPDWMLGLGNASIGTVRFQHHVNGRLLTDLRSGTQMPFALRPVASRELAFPVTMQPGHHEIVLQIESYTSLILAPTLVDPLHWFESGSNESLLLGVFCGLLLVMALYNLSVSMLVSSTFTLRRRSKVWTMSGSAYPGQASTRSVSDARACRGAMAARAPQNCRRLGCRVIIH